MEEDCTHISAVSGRRVLGFSWCDCGLRVGCALRGSSSYARRSIGVEVTGLRLFSDAGETWSCAQGVRRE